MNTEYSQRHIAKLMGIPLSRMQRILATVEPTGGTEKRPAYTIARGSLAIERYYTPDEESETDKQLAQARARLDLANAKRAELKLQDELYDVVDLDLVMQLNAFLLSSLTVHIDNLTDMFARHYDGTLTDSMLQVLEEVKDNCRNEMSNLWGLDARGYIRKYAELKDEDVKLRRLLNADN